MTATKQREADVEKYIDYLAEGSEDPAISKLARTDVFVIRQVFRAGWEANADHSRHPHAVDGECWD